MSLKTIGILLSAIIVLLTILVVEGMMILSRLSNPLPERSLVYQNASYRLGYVAVPVNADGTINVKVQEMPADTRVYIAGVGSSSVWGPNLPVEIKDAESRAFNRCEMPIRLESVKYGLKLPVEVK